MSRRFEMTLGIQGANPDRVEAIKKAAEHEWPFEDWDDRAGLEDPTRFLNYAEGTLAGGETDDAFAARLAKAVWEANGGYCEVEVRAVYLDDLPCETYTFDEDEYEELVEQEKPGRTTEPSIPADWAVRPLRPEETCPGRATCGVCGLSWDNDLVTSMTPAPSGRCPFEAFHKG